MCIEMEIVRYGTVFSFVNFTEQVESIGLGKKFVFVEKESLENVPVQAIQIQKKEVYVASSKLVSENMKTLHLLKNFSFWRVDGVKGAFRASGDIKSFFQNNKLASVVCGNDAYMGITSRIIKLLKDKGLQVMSMVEVGDELGLDRDTIMGGFLTRDVCILKVGMMEYVGLFESDWYKKVPCGRFSVKLNPTIYKDVLPSIYTIDHMSPEIDILGMMFSHPKDMYYVKDVLSSPVILPDIPMVILNDGEVQKHDDVTIVPNPSSHDSIEVISVTDLVVEEQEVVSDYPVTTTDWLEDSEQLHGSANNTIVHGHVIETTYWRQVSNDERMGEMALLLEWRNRYGTDEVSSAIDARLIHLLRN